MAFNAPMNVVPYSPMWNPMSHFESMNPLTHFNGNNWMNQFEHQMMHPMMHQMMHPMGHPMMSHSMKNWMRHSLPREIRDVAFRPMSMVEYNSFMTPVTFHPDGSRTLNLCFDVKGFKPEEIKVEILTKERTIVVEAKHEVKDKEHQVTRHFTRRFVVPEELHIDLSKIELKSCLTPEGLLVVESVLPRLTVEELKTMREKQSTKSPMHPMHPMHSVESVFNPTVAIPIKMN